MCIDVINPYSCSLTVHLNVMFEVSVFPASFHSLYDRLVELHRIYSVWF